MVHLDRSLVFPCVDYIRYIVTKAGRSWAEGKFPVAIDCKHIHYADYTAAQVLLYDSLFVRAQSTESWLLYV